MYILNVTEIGQEFEYLRLILSTKTKSLAGIMNCNILVLFSFSPLMNQLYRSPFLC